MSEIDHAITDCDSALHLDENRIEAYVLRAKARLEKSSEMRTVGEVADCDRAVDDCQQAIGLSKKFKGDAEGTKQAKSLRGLAHELRGSIYQNLRAAKKALAEYERALALDPYLVSTLLRRAVTRSTTEDYGGALNDCNTAISIDSARPEAYSGRGWIYAVKGEFSKAIEDFTQAVSLDRKCAKALAGRASVHATMAALLQAREQELAKAKRPANRAEIALYQEKANELRQKCIDDATEAIRANRHLAKAYLTRGLAYARQQIPEKALADFNAAIREDPKLVRAYYNRAVLFNNQRRFNEAIKDFQQASKLLPQSSLIYHRLFQIYQEVNDVILLNKYYAKWQESLKQDQQEQDLEAAEFSVKHKPAREPEVRPDSELEPIDRAKIDLEKKLDATAEQ